MVGDSEKYRSEPKSVAQLLFGLFGELIFLKNDPEKTRKHHKVCMVKTRLFCRRCSDLETNWFHDGFFIASFYFVTWNFPVHCLRTITCYETTVL